MTALPDRRTLMLALAAAAALPDAAAAQTASDAPLRALEDGVQGWLGVMALRADGRILLSHRANDRFPITNAQNGRFARACVDAMHQYTWRTKRCNYIGGHIADTGRGTGGDDNQIAFGQSPRCRCFQGVKIVSNNAV